MTSVELTVRNPHGLHARPLALFVDATARFASTITVENLDRGNGPRDAKSLLLVLTAGVQQGHRVHLVAEGPDETEAIETLRALIESGLGEEIEPASPGGS